MGPAGKASYLEETPKVSQLCVARLGVQNFCPFDRRWCLSRGTASEQ